MCHRINPALPRPRLQAEDRANPRGVATGRPAGTEWEEAAGEGIAKACSWKLSRASVQKNSFPPVCVVG